MSRRIKNVQLSACVGGCRRSTISTLTMSSFGISARCECTRNAQIASHFKCEIARKDGSTGKGREIARPTPCRLLAQKQGEAVLAGLRSPSACGWPVGMRPETAAMSARNHGEPEPFFSNTFRMRPVRRSGYSATPLILLAREPSLQSCCGEKSRIAIMRLRSRRGRPAALPSDKIQRQKAFHAYQFRSPALFMMHF
jgi:hypothetical protein